MDSFDILAIMYYAVLAFLVIGTVWFVLDLEFNKNHLTNATPVKFKEFRKWYVVAPDKYLLMDTYAFRKDCFITVIFNNPIDALRYRSFAKKVRKNNNLEEYQKYVQKDMNAVYEMVKNKKK
mgnify:CR=1 FL=1